MTIDEAIAKYKEITNTDANCPIHCMRTCDKCVQESGQLAEWLEELKALRLLLDWAIECDFGLDSFPEEYEKYKHTLTEDMTYNDMIIQIAKCVVAEQLKESD